MSYFRNFTLLVVFCGLRGEGLCSSTKLFPHYLLLSHGYESNSNKGIEEECKKGMHWFRLLNTTAFIQKDVYGCTDYCPALGHCVNMNTEK